MADGDGSDASEQQSMPAPTPPKRRNQYNLEFKLEVANQYTPGVLGRSFEALARQYGLHKSSIMAWVAKKDLMAERLAAKGGSSAGRHAFRLDGCGRKSSHSVLEDELERWMRLQSASGERVRDKDVKEKAMRIYLDMHGGVAPSSGPHVFKASSGWLARFKLRKNFAVRRASRGGDSDDVPAAPSPLQAALPVAIAPCPVSLAAVLAPECLEPTPMPAAGAAPPSVAATVAVTSRSADLSPQMPRVTATHVTCVTAAPTAQSSASASVTSITPAVFVAGQHKATVGAKRQAVALATVAATTPEASTAAVSTPTTTASQSASFSPAITHVQATTQVPPDVSAVPTAWMESVDRRLDDLAHKLEHNFEHLVNGQNLLLGMLQRLTPLALSSATRVAIASVSSVPPVGSLRGVDGSAASVSRDDTIATAIATSFEAAPVAKRRRES